MSNTPHYVHTQLSDEVTNLKDMNRRLESLFFRFFENGLETKLLGPCTLAHLDIPYMPTWYATETGIDSVTRRQRASLGNTLEQSICDRKTVIQQSTNATNVFVFYLLKKQGLNLQAFSKAYSKMGEQYAE